MLPYLYIDIARNARRLGEDLDIWGDGENVSSK